MEKDFEAFRKGRLVTAPVNPDFATLEGVRHPPKVSLENDPNSQRVADHIAGMILDFSPEGQNDILRMVRKIIAETRERQIQEAYDQMKQIESRLNYLQNSLNNL
jgi:hypothetical protein